MQFLALTPADTEAVETVAAEALTLEIAAVALSAHTAANTVPITLVLIFFFILISPLC